MKTADDPIIRPYGVVDRARVIALLHDSYLTTWAPHVTDQAWLRWFDQRRPEAYVTALGNEFVVAEINGEVVGMSHWRDDFIHALHVHSRWRRRGIGASLLRQAESAITANGHETIRLETDSFNVTSRSFYAANGYVQTGSRPDTEWDSGLTTLHLAKKVEIQSRSV